MITERKELKPLTVRIPNWLGSIESLTQKVNLKPDRVRAIIHQFFLAWLKHGIISKNRKRNLLPDYFAVSSEILKEVGTKDYTRSVNLLIAEKIVERKSSGEKGRCYMVGEHAQLYRWILPPDSVGFPQFRIEKVTDYSTIKSILRTRDNHQKIDCKLKEAGRLHPVFEILKSYVLDTTTCDSNNNVIDEINWFVVDEFGGRFHHVISSMPKEQRKYLRFKGHEQTPLVTIDFRNSQPFFSAMLSSKTLIETLLPEFKPVIPLAEKINNKPDFLLYRQLCVEGRLYEFFVGAHGIDSSNQLERHKIKTDLFRAVLYCKKRVYGNDKRLQDEFKSVFPNVFSFFSEIKNMNEFDLPALKSIIKPVGKTFKYNQGNNSYKLLPCMMQRAESRMMYQVIAPKMIEAGIKFVTVHDSFILQLEHVENTKGIITKSFESIDLPAPTLCIT